MGAYRFGPFVLEPGERRLLRDGAPVPLTPKVFDTLVYLVEHHGRLVGKNQLLEAVWGGSHVEEGSAARAIHVLRKALAGTDRADGHDRQYIATVPTKGYRFVAPVQPAEGIQSVPPVAASSNSPAARTDRPGRAESWRSSAMLATTALLVLALAASAWRARDAHEPRIERHTPHTGSGAAYARYQGARVLLERHLSGDIDAALAGFEAAIELDPHFAAAYAGRADARLFRYSNTGAHDDIAQARLAIGRALALDDASGYAHSVHCRLLGTYDWDFAAAEGECRRAVDLEPAYDQVRRELAFLLNALGRRREALQEMETAITIAPTSFNKRSRGVLLYFDRRFDEAVIQLRQVEATDPAFPGARRWIARSLEQKGDYAGALEAFAGYLELAGTAPRDIEALRRAFTEGGWPDVLRMSLALRRAEPPELETAGSYAQLGEYEAAFEMLEAMVRARRLMIVHIDSEPRLDPIRADPRFEELARRVGLRQASRATFAR